MHYKKECFQEKYKKILSKKRRDESFDFHLCVLLTKISFSCFAHENYVRAQNFCAVISIRKSYIISKGQHTFKLYGTHFQPTVLCVIRLVPIPLIRITHKTAGTPQAKKRLSIISLWGIISIRQSFFIISKS